MVDWECETQKQGAEFTKCMSTMEQGRDSDSEGMVDPALLFDYDRDAELGSVVCLYSQLVCVILFFVWLTMRSGC